MVETKVVTTRSVGAAGWRWQRRAREVDKLAAFIAVSISAPGVGCQSSPPRDNLGSVEAFISDPGCADILLRVSPRTPDKTYAISTTSRPSIAVLLDAAPHTHKVRITIQDCETSDANVSGDAGAKVHTTIVRPFRTSKSFWILGGEADRFRDDRDDEDNDPEFREHSWNHSEWENECHSKTELSRCVRITALAYDKKRISTGHATAVVRRGDNSISGSIAPPSGYAPFDGGLGLISHVTITVDGQTIGTDTDRSGVFGLEHVADGTLVRATADLRDFFVLGGLRGDIAPLLPLDKDHRTVTLTIPLSRDEYPIDLYEPDNTIATVATQPSLALGQSYSHSIAAKTDIDFSPLEVTNGTSYHIVVTPTGNRPGDLGLAVLDKSGTVLAHANDSLGEFMKVPTLDFKAAQDERVFIRVRRSDDERVNAPYTLQVGQSN